MQSYISYLVKEVYARYNDVSRQCIFILPSKRAALFLKKAIAKEVQGPTLAPEIYSIEEFIENIAGITSANTTTQIFELYNAYLQVGNYQKESFDSFLTWGQTLLQDFNEIDRYLVEANNLYQNVAAIQELNHWSIAKEKTELIENYLHFWRHLADIYTTFNASLLAQNLGHQGLIYKTAAANLETYLSKVTKVHIFAGFNALNTAETSIIQQILETKESVIYWDLDSAFLEDPIHDAGYFIRSYQKNWPIFKREKLRGISTNYYQTKDIEVIGVPKNISQANYVGALLSKIHQNNPERLTNTAIVLGNEDLLNPVLNAIPDKIPAVNITMGQKLAATTLASFFMNLLEFYDNKSEKGWFYQSLLQLLTHSYTALWFHSIGVSVEKMVTKIKTNNWTYVTAAQLKQLIPAAYESHFKLLSHTQEQPSAIIDHLLALVTIFREIASTQENNVLLEQLYKFDTLFHQLKEVCSAYPYIKDLKSLLPLYKQLLASESLDFQGNPIEGIQLMGMLESRLLDFETVIITGVNEGILPSGKTNNSFIPFDLKKSHGLPTYKEKDAVYTYHFYRLIQRAKHVYILYNTEPEVLEGGERSRLITQLLTDKKRTDITAYMATPNIYNPQEASVFVSKSPSLQKRIFEKSANGFSPSSLSNYIRNPLAFYKQNLLDIKDVLEVEESLAANTFGTIVHDSLEELYTPFLNTVLTEEALQRTKTQVAAIVLKNFEKSYKEGDIKTGKNYLSYHVILKYINNYLESQITECKSHQIKILELETSMTVSLSIPGCKTPVILKGKLDRVEEYDGIVRIIDYKTGSVEEKNVKTKDWNTLITDYQYSKSFQLLCYALMFQKTYPNKEVYLQAGIISFKNFQAGTLLFAKIDTTSNVKKDIIDQEILAAFEQTLAVLIQEIQDPEIPFTEKKV